MPTNIQEVLIIEADDLFFYALKPKLESKGLVVARARDGKDGVAKCKKNDYSLVMTDIILPKMNGFEVIKFLRSEHHKNPRIIVVSDFSMSIQRSDHNFFNSLGIDKYLIKSKHSATDIAGAVLECLL